MKKILCLYSTIDGQTIKIFEHIKRELDGYQCVLIDLHKVDKLDLQQYERVIVGASIRYGHLNKKLYQFIDSHLEQLKINKVAFFCVNLTARKEEQKKDTPEGSMYIRTFLKKSPWKPELIGVFAGALRYPKYKLFDRVCIQFIMKITGGETDVTKEVEYTNWKKVSLFAQSVINM